MSARSSSSRRREPAPTAVARPQRLALAPQLLAWQCPACPRPLRQRSIRPLPRTGATLRYVRLLSSPLHFPFLRSPPSFSTVPFHIGDRQTSSAGEVSGFHGEEYEDAVLWGVAIGLMMQTTLVSFHVVRTPYFSFFSCFSQFLPSSSNFLRCDLYTVFVFFFLICSGLLLFYLLLYFSFVSVRF